MQNLSAPYTLRNPRLSDYYRCIEEFFEELERVHEELYQARFGQRNNEDTVIHRRSGGDPQDLGLWDIPKRQPKRGREPPVQVETEPQLVYADSQVIEYKEAYYIPEYL